MELQPTWGWPILVCVAALALRLALAFLTQLRLRARASVWARDASAEVLYPNRDATPPNDPGQAQLPKATSIQTSGTGISQPDQQASILRARHVPLWNTGRNLLRGGLLRKLRLSLGSASPTYPIRVLGKRSIGPQASVVHLRIWEEELAICLQPAVAPTILCRRPIITGPTSEDPTGESQS